VRNVGSGAVEGSSSRHASMGGQAGPTATCSPTEARCPTRAQSLSSSSVTETDLGEYAQDHRVLPDRSAAASGLRAV